MKTPLLIPPQTPFEQSVDTALRVLQIPDAGLTSSRPRVGQLVGQVFFDTELGLPVWWDGHEWVNAVGAPS